MCPEVGYERSPGDSDYASDTAQGGANLRQLRSLTASAMSPWADEAESHVRDWVRSFGLVRSDRAKERFDKTAAGALAARVYASAVSPFKLILGAEWIGWLFLLDDQLDEGDVGRNPAATRAFLRPLAESLHDGLADGSPVGSPLRGSLRDIRRRVMSVMPTSWREIFNNHVAEYMKGCEWEAANRAQGRVPGLAEFPSQRRTAGAIWPSLDLLEFVTDGPLPDRVRSEPVFAELCRAAADVVCWTDDVMTVDKERARGDVHNLVIVLEHETGCTADSAVVRAEQRIDSRLGDFIEYECRLAKILSLADADAAARRAAELYLAGLRNWMRGHLEWGISTIRYNSVEQTATNAVPSYLERLQ